MAETEVYAFIAQNIYVDGQATYPGAHDASEGTVGTSISFYLDNTKYDNYYAVSRGYLSFDTFFLGASAVIDTAILKMYVITGGSPCFPNGTLVYTPKGATKIENIETGVVIWSLNLLTNRLEQQRVTKVIRSIGNQTIIRITTKHGVVECTPTHSFMVPGKGWIRAAALKVGNFLLNKSSELIPIAALDLVTIRTAVQDLIVNTNHNYFVGKEMLLVHNRHTEIDPGQATIHVVEGVHGDTLEPDDFGDLLPKTTSGGSISHGDIVQGWNEISLNATGRGWISKTGITKLGLRLAGDIDNSTPTGYNSLEIMSESSSYAPVLTITYSAGWSGTIGGVTNPANVMGIPAEYIAKVKGVA